MSEAKLLDGLHPALYLSFCFNRYGNNVCRPISRSTQEPTSARETESIADLGDYLLKKTGEFKMSDVSIQSNVTATEKINHPSHYGGDTVYEAIKVIEAWELDNDFCLGNTIKYLARAGKKDDILQDLKKAAWYLNRKIENLERQRGQLQST